MPAENAGRAFALVLVDELVRHGVRHAVIAPGSRSTPLAIAFAERPEVQTHVRIDERSASFLALGIAKESGDVVPVVCTSGTATAHFHAAVVEADLARIPLLVLTADRPPELHGIGANQTIEQEGLFGHAVRLAPRIPTPQARDAAVDEWRELVRDAWSYCQGRHGAPPGPVHLNLPFREPLVPVDDGVGFPYDLALGHDGHAPQADLASRPPEQLVERLAGVRSGVVVVGSIGAHGTASGAVDLAVAAGWPIIAEPQSGARRGPNALRAADVLLRDRRFADSHRPDLALVVGRVGLSRTLLAWLEATPHVVVSPDGGNWDVTGTAEAVIQAPASVLPALSVTAAEPPWAKDWLAASAVAGDAIDQLLDDAERLSEPRVARNVADLVPDGTALVVGSSMPIRDLDLVMRPREALTVYANRGASGIDGFVSTAIGIAMSRRTSMDDDGPRTVALCGDLSLLHDINGLLPGPDPRPDISFVVINNDGGGIFSVLPQWKQVAPDIAERIWGTPHHMSIEALAAAYQVEHTLVGTAEELTRAMSSYGGVRIIEVRTDRAENAALHQRLRAITLG